MPSMKPCNLTEKEWDFFCEIFQFFYDENELTPEEDEQMSEIHAKIFFMDALIKDKDDESND